MASDNARAATTQRARIAVITQFFCSGAGLGVWATRLPAIKESLHLRDGDIGVALFLAAMGAVTALRVAGRVIERFGSRRSTQVAGVALAVSLLLPALARNASGLGISLVALGAASSLQDVAMNSQAVAIQNQSGRPIMSSFHAAFSIGGIAGAAIGALTAKLNISYRATFVGIAMLLAAVLLAANRGLLDTPETRERSAHAGRDLTPLPHRRLILVLGLIGLVCFVSEGAATDWTTIYLREGTGATAAGAAVGFVAFSVAMTGGRLAGDRLASRFGAFPLIRAGTALAGIGLLIGLAVGTTAAGVVGFIVFGLGLSTVVPQVFSVAGTLAPARAAAALSLVSSVSYLGYLAGPASIGAIADHSSLRRALALPGLLILVGSLIATRLQAASAGAGTLVAGEVASEDVSVTEPP